MKSRSDLLEEAKKLPATPGVYLMKDEKNLLLYVGKAISLKSRVSSYFQESAQHVGKNMLMVGKIDKFEVIECASEVEALLKEARLIKDLQPPFNIMLKDSKAFPYIEITGHDDFPIVRVTREKHVSTSQYYGPFTTAGTLRPALDLLQKVLQFRNCDLEIFENSKSQKTTRPCLLYQIGRCTAPCAGHISKQEYAKDIKDFKILLQGKMSKLKKMLNEQMEKTSASFEYEKAAHIRNRIKALENLKEAGPLGSQVELEIAPINPESGMEDLGKVLGLDFTPRSIEGFDIAHLQGNQTVASLVSFIDGKPFKEGYRQFKIKTPTGGDDYAAMKEVLTRRYSRLQKEGQPFPHIVLIDGGKGQLGVAVDVFKTIGRPDQMILSLAKKEEKIYVPGRDRAHVLKRHETALRVLQHVRDEAHRFAQRYHHLLRDKQLFED